ncbi:MAG: hypothetical protein ACE5Z5_11655 [Candidatus Bathyarchaeia archaeon]
MGDWWVYENWMVNRVRVHRGECSFCKHGKGIHPNKVEGQHMKWYGPYLTRDEAWAVAQRLGRNDTISAHFVVNS